MPLIAFVVVAVGQAVLVNWSTVARVGVSSGWLAGRIGILSGWLSRLHLVRFCGGHAAHVDFASFYRRAYAFWVATTL